MSQVLDRIRKTFVYELPIIRLYALLYLIGIVIGVIGAILLRKDFSSEAQFLLSAENAGTFFAAFLQQFFSFLILFFLGLTVIGLPLIPFFPLYKGFSLGLLVSLSVIFSGVRGFLFGTLSFFVQNLYYTLLAYFLCYSSTRLSISLFTLMRGRAKHGVPYREFQTHTLCFLILIPLLCLGALWESRMVPVFLNLF